MASVAVAVAVAASPWTGLKVIGLNLSDIALVIGGLVILIEHFLGKRHLLVYWWMLAPSFAAVIVLALHVVLFGQPLMTALNRSDSMQGTATFSESGGALLFAARLLLATSLTSIIAYSEVATGGRAHAVRLLRVLCVGTLCSSAAAVLSSIGALDLSSVSYGITTERAVGLAFHPNSLALSQVLVIPLLVFFAQAAVGMTRRLAWMLAIGLSSYALYLADSRAGLLVGALVLVVALVSTSWTRAGRKWLLPMLLLVVGALAVSVGPLAATTRLATISFDADQSIIARAAFLESGGGQFAASPLIGVGLGAGDGVSIPVLLLSSGGVVLFASFAWFLASPLRRMFSARQLPLVRACLLSTLAMILMGIFNNGFAERFSYWSLAIGAACAALSLREASSSGEAGLAESSPREYLSTRP